MIKHGTLSVGFIGLAETLKALIGVHHGESEAAQKLGLEIIGHMRQRMDEESQRTGLNFTLLATPAEGLSGRFVRIDQKSAGQDCRGDGSGGLHKLFPCSRLLPHQIL